MEGVKMAEEKTELIEEGTNDAVVESAGAREKKVKKSMMFKILISVGIVVFVLLGVSGYGFWNGYQIQAYAGEAEKTFAVTTSWDTFFAENDLTKVKDNVVAIKKESTDALNSINSKAVPTGAKSLKADLIEYFTISKRIASDAEGIVAWATEIEKVSNEFGAMTTLDTSTPEAMAAAIDKAKVGIDAAIVKLEEMTVPETIKVQHEQYLAMLKTLSATYGKLSTALKANDLNALSTITNEFSSASADYSSLENPNDTVTKSWEKDKERLDALEVSINDAIKKLKTVKFSF